MLIDGQEIAERYTEYGIRNTVTGMVIECENESEAHFDALLYPNSEVVKWEVYVTGKVVISGETPKSDGL